MKTSTLPFIVSALAAVSIIAASIASAADATAGGKDGDFKAYSATVPGSKIKFDMVPIPAGRFLLGSPDTEKERKKEEGPQMEVEVEAFWMGKCEVTWDELDVFAAEYGVAKEARDRGQPIPKDKMADAVSLPTLMWEQEATPILNAMGRGGGYPAAAMSHFSAMQYTKWLSKRTGKFHRLPTEAEWEYACRAGTTTAYSFGDDPKKLEDYAWYFNNSSYDPNLDLGFPGSGAGYRKVGQKKPNPWGLHDLYGNVAEWVIDQYSAEHYNRFAGKRTKAADLVNWPKKIYPCATRGGSWDAPEEACRSASREGSSRNWNRADPGSPQSLWWLTGGYHVGFRIIRPVKEPDEATKLRYWDGDIEEIQKVLKTSFKEIQTLPTPDDAKPRQP